jgi:hypothetical protein
LPRVVRLFTPEGALTSTDTLLATARRTPRDETRVTMVVPPPPSWVTRSAHLRRLAGGSGDLDEDV